MIRSLRFSSLAAAGTTAFIVWVSLFPFEFRALPWATARDLLWSTRPLVFDVASWSVTDVVSNAALFVPFGLFGSAAFAQVWGIRRGLGPVITSTVLFSVSLEFAQAFVIWRAPSLLDVAASTAGAVSGVIIWRRCRRGVDSFASEGERLWGASSGLERSLLIYTGIFVCGWLLPFDVTIRLDEIRDKYEHQRLVLPLSTSPDAATSSRLALAVVAAIPFGIASRVCARRQGEHRRLGRAVSAAALSLLLLEIVQVSVFSRTTDATELLVAVPGAALGAYLAGRA